MGKKEDDDRCDEENYRAGKELLKLRAETLKRGVPITGDNGEIIGVDYTIIEKIFDEARAKAVERAVGHLGHKIADRGKGEQSRN